MALLSTISVIEYTTAYKVRARLEKCRPAFLLAAGPLPPSRHAQVVAQVMLPCLPAACALWQNYSQHHYLHRMLDNMLAALGIHLGGRRRRRGAAPLQPQCLVANGGSSYC
jgi:hypothetical protein